MQERFSLIYERGAWGGLSGEGSGLRFNKDYIFFLNKYLIDHNIKSVVDLGCGDFVIGRAVFLYNSHISYVGIDCVKLFISMFGKLYQTQSHLRFLHMDIFEERNNLPKADLYIIKDVIQHWPNKLIYEFLDFWEMNHKNDRLMVVNSYRLAKDDRDIRRIGLGRSLSASCLPLKKYNPKILFHYQDKEVSILNDS